MGKRRGGRSRSVIPSVKLMVANMGSHVYRCECGRPTAVCSVIANLDNRNEKYLNVIFLCEDCYPQISSIKNIPIKDLEEIINTEIVNKHKNTELIPKSI